MTASVLLTGFTSFAGRSVNAAATLATALDSVMIGGHQIQSELLKVSWDAVETFATQTLPTVQFDCIVALGEADRSHISIETRATTACSGEDIDGRSPLPITDHAGVADQSITLASAGVNGVKIAALTNLCEGSQVSTQSCSEKSTQNNTDAKVSRGVAPAVVQTNSVQLSTDAGDYLCNRLLYLGLKHAPCPFIFVHVPLQQNQPQDAYLRQHLASLETIIETFVTA